MEDFVLEAPLDERTMLLELADDLSRWEVRNQAFRQALDRTVQNLVDLAHGGPRPWTAEGTRPDPVR